MRDGTGALLDNLLCGCTQSAECVPLLRRDTRWHGGSDSNQQDKAEVEPDWSPEAERRRWGELQEAFQARRERGFGAGGVSMFMALVEDGGCHEIVPRSHREWRKDSQYNVLRRIDGVSGHAPMEDAVAIRLRPQRAAGQLAVAGWDAGRALPGCARRRSRRHGRAAQLRRGARRPT